MLDWPFEIMRDEIVWIVVLGVMTFHQLVHAQKRTLLSIIIIGGFAYVAYIYLQKRANTIEDTQQNVQTLFQKEAAARKEVNTDKAFLSTFPKKGFKYIRENQGLTDIAKGLVITRMFDRARYGDMLLGMEKLQKVYMYILDGRYDAKSQIHVFLDLRESILEIMYSLYFVIPKKIKHVYGLDPYKRIEESIDQFKKLSYVMIEVLKSYTRKTAKEPYFPELFPSPADAPFDHLRNRRLP